MGNWNINIQGVGCHHNKGNPKDANIMAGQFVKSLQKAGHSVESATFTYGGKDGLMSAEPAPEVGAAPQAEDPTAESEF